MANDTRRGFSRTELVVASAAAIVLCSLMTVAFARDAKEQPRSARTIAIITKDATQQRGIHQACLVHARESEGVFPTPGLIRRLPIDGQMIPGRGQEDITQNTTANLHSVMIMWNYYAPDILISPLERSPFVRSIEKDGGTYRYEVYNAVEGVFWDTEFKADLAKLSHVSFAHMPIAGERKIKQWRDTLDSHFAVFGSRGPKDGLLDHTSITCGPLGHWAGNIVRHDNASVVLTSPIWERGNPENPIADNIFAIEGGLDVILSFTSAIADNTPQLQFD